MALVEHDAPVKVLTATPMHKLLESTSLTCIPIGPIRRSRAAEPEQKSSTL